MRKVLIIKTLRIAVEFEFESYNYIRHGHLKENDKCHMIICWEDNSRSDEKLKERDSVKKLPPILSLKKDGE